MNTFGLRQPPQQGAMGGMAGAAGGMQGGGAPATGQFDAQRLARLQSLRASAPQYGAQGAPQRAPMAAGAPQRPGMSMPAQPVPQRQAMPRAMAASAPPQRQPMVSAAPPQQPPPRKPPMQQAPQQGMLSQFNGGRGFSMF